MTTETANKNPLLIGDGLPPFAEIEPGHVEPAIKQLLGELDQELTELEIHVKPTWSALVEPVERLGERLAWSWGIVNHLMGVKNSPELRAAHEKMQPDVIEFYNRLGQSQPLYQAYKALRDSAEWDTLEPAQKRIITAAIRSAEHSGVGLEGEKKERFGPQHRDVVHAMVHEVLPDGVVAAHREGDFQLRADAINAGNEHRLFVVAGVEREQPAKAAKCPPPLSFDTTH